MDSLTKLILPKRALIQDEHFLLFGTIQEFIIFCLPYVPLEPLRGMQSLFDIKDETRACCCFFCLFFLYYCFNLLLVSRARFFFLMAPQDKVAWVHVLGRGRSYLHLLLVGVLASARPLCVYSHDRSDKEVFYRLSELKSLAESNCKQQSYHWEILAEEKITRLSLSYS